MIHNIKVIVFLLLGGLVSQLQSIHNRNSLRYDNQVRSTGSVQISRFMNAIRQCGELIIGQPTGLSAEIGQLIDMKSKLQSELQSVYIEIEHIQVSSTTCNLFHNLTEWLPPSMTNCLPLSINKLNLLKQKLETEIQIIDQKLIFMNNELTNHVLFHKLIVSLFKNRYTTGQNSFKNSYTTGQNSFKDSYTTGQNSFKDSYTTGQNSYIAQPSTCNILNIFFSSFFSCFSGSPRFDIDD